MSLGLSREERLMKTYQFLQIKAQGLSTRAKPFWIQARLESEGPCKLGIIATKRLGNAAARNRAKRLIRELFRRNKHKLPRALGMVVLPRRSILKTPFHELETLFIDALFKASNRL